MNWNQPSIELFGLTETEKAVLSCITTENDIEGIVKEAKLSRTGVNHVLKKLIGKGLVKAQPHGKRRQYISISSDELSLKIQRILDDILLSKSEKKGARIKTSKADEFIIHVGTKEIIPAYERIAFAHRNERIKAIQHHRSYKELIDKMSSAQLVRFNEAIIKNKLIIDGILNKSAYRTYKDEIKSDPKKYSGSAKSLEGRMADYTVFSDEFFNHDAEIWIFKNTILIINWHDEVAIEITNASMTSFLRDMFEFVKAGGEKLDHNEAIRKLLE